MQTTLKAALTFTGTGLHTGKPVRMTVRPAAAETGIWFKRTDILLGDNMIPARYDSVSRTPLCTLLVNRAGASVSTVEHLMAAFAGCGIHNALVEIDGPEVPILDGSSVEFVRAFLRRGLQAQDAPLRTIEVLKPVKVATDAGWACLSPSTGFSMAFHISFPDAAIGTQEKQLNLRNGAFVRELSDSRTFCRQSDVDAMQANGLALGGVPGENAVVFDGDDIVSPGGLRHEDEPVRHKMLDALGDLALAGAPIVGHYEGHRAGHAITNMLLHKLFETPGAFRMIECSANMAEHLPGTGVTRGEIPQVA
ncbi:MAG: UDP-3-O-acyl-N-acetylglucosamine deacetylase [Roseivivax sp.]|nr:UDP-3-O-acyl-N-acetylglucosamine deacetylase [Roseivivax sp.]